MEFNNNELCKQIESNKNIGLILLDNNYNITKVNSFITSSTEYDESEVIGKNINFLISSHDYHDSFTNIISSRLDKKKSLDLKHEIKKADGSFFWSNINGQIYEEYSLWFIIPAQNINKKEKAIKEIISSIYKKDDSPFMDSITLQIAKTLNADHVFVGEIQDTQLSVKTLSHCMDKKIVDGFEYNLKDTPCELVYDGKPSVFPQDVTTLFPKDQDLKDLSIEGYAGIPLFNNKNETLGLLVLLYRKPIKDPEFITSTISLFANIISNEFERQRAEEAVNEQAVYYQSIIDGVKEPLMVIDAEYNIVLMNKAADAHKRLSTIKDIKHPKCYEVSHKQDTPCDGVSHPCPLKEAMETGKQVVLTHDHPDENGVSDYVELTATPLYDKNDNFIGIIESAKDITEQIHTREQLKIYKDKLHYEEHYNSLTKLPNRILYYDRVAQAIKFANKNKNKFAILFIDVDNFKSINDSLGIDAGNEVLKHVAQRLKGHIKDSDSIAHFGADEFGIVLQSIKDTNKIIDYVDSLINIFKESIIVEDNKIYITVSIGISIYPDDNIKSDDLIKFADSALHKAKENGKNTYEFYTKDLTDEAYNRIVLENSLREAIPNNELVSYYQPKVDAKDGSIVGMEALVRWRNKDGVLVPPNDFIPLAEEIRLISNIDIWMINNVSKTVSSWYKKGLNPGVVSINITIQTLRMYGFKNLFMEILEENRCDPKYIELEITESQLMKNPEQTINILNDIKKMGIKISVDDFGTGYSSLAYLKKLPIDKLKIDKAFIDELPHDEEDVAISKTIISLAHSLKLDIIAEGVENKEQKDFLVENGCDTIQGYFYYKPLQSDKIEELI
jgi:diguanylate cyclase (GGDEF)-like protein/PAS domain S-box-containing protein